jgi:hypothetical protein
MVAFIHQNSKSSYAQIFFASKAIAWHKIVMIYGELPQLNYAYYPLLLDIVTYLNYYP